MDTTPRVNGSRIRVSTPVLRAQADRWDAASQELTRQAQGCDALSLSGSRPGPFAGFLPGYQGLVQQLHDRLTEGAGATSAIADTLVGVANQYEAHDTEQHETLSRLDED